MATWRLTLCVCVCVSLCVSEARDAFVPPKMNRTIHSLLMHYKTSQAMFNGKPVFPRPSMTGKTETKMVLMGGILQTYDTLIGRMLDQLPTASPEGQPSASDDVASASSAVRSDLSYIRTKVQELKESHFKEQEKLLQRLQDLGQIQMDNGVIQSKALRELLPLYQEASELSDRKMRRRRRRQAKGRKHPDA